MRENTDAQSLRTATRSQHVAAHRDCGGPWCNRLEGERGGEAVGRSTSSRMSMRTRERRCFWRLPVTTGGVDSHRNLAGKVTRPGDVTHLRGTVRGLDADAEVSFDVLSPPATV